MSSGKAASPQTKNVQRIAVPSTFPPPPPRTDMPPFFSSFPTTTPSLKHPPIKKTCRSNAIIKGQVGTKFFSLERAHPYTELPDGCSLIISTCRKPLPHKKRSKYKIYNYRCFRHEVDST